MPELLHITMPQPGETISHGTLVAWRVAPGAIVKEGDIIAELETEKAVFEFESPFEGKITELLAGPQQSVPVGKPIATIEVSDEKANGYKLLGLGEEVTPKAANEPMPSAPVQIRPEQPPQKARALSPLLRALVKENKLSPEQVSQIPATGPGGRVTKKDFEGFLKGTTTSPYQSSLTEDGVIPCSPIRLRTAQNMVLSKQTIPHAHTGLAVDMTRLIEYREKNKAAFERDHGVPLGLLTLIAPALVKAVAEVPSVNASFVDKGGQKQIVLHRKINLGIAIDTDRGLYIPVLPDIASKDRLHFARDLEALLKRAQDNKLTVDDLTGMSMTFNNFGFFGTTLGIQVVPPGQSSILGMGKIEKQPWVVGDCVGIRQVANFVLAFDHRVMDGRDAGRFLSSLKNSLENF